MMCSSGTFLLRAKPSPTEIGISAPKMIKTTFNRHLRLHAVTNLIVLCGQSVQFKLGHLPLPHFLAAWRNPRVVWLIPPILARFASSPHSIGDRWLSGLRHSTRNRAYPLKVPWVRLPPCPPSLEAPKKRLHYACITFHLKTCHFSVMHPYGTCRCSPCAQDGSGGAIPSGGVEHGSPYLGRASQTA